MENNVKNLEQEKEKIYVMLDFDGVMYDIDHLLNLVDSFKNRKTAENKDERKTFFAPESIEALNVLMKGLSTKYDPTLVLSTLWRNAFPIAEKVLKMQGVELDDYEVTRTGLSIDLTSKARGRAIEKYLTKLLKENENPNPNIKPKIVIIDDLSDVLEYIPEDLKECVDMQFIHTSGLQEKNGKFVPQQSHEVLQYFGCESVVNENEEVSVMGDE